MTELTTLLECYAGCVNNLNSVKSCDTCKHENTNVLELPCSECYNEMLFMPVDPTNWEAK